MEKEKCRCSQSEGKHMLMGCSCPCHSQSESIEPSLQKESEWVDELKNLLEKQGVDIMEDGGHQIFDEQVALIKRIVSTREKEIAEEVEKMKEGLMTDNNGSTTCNSRCHDSGKETALDEVLLLMKK